MFMEFLERLSAPVPVVTALMLPGCAGASLTAYPRGAFATYSSSFYDADFPLVLVETLIAAEFAQDITQAELDVIVDAEPFLLAIGDYVEVNTGLTDEEILELIASLNELPNVV